MFVEASAPDDPSKYPFLDDFKKICPDKNPEDGIMMQLSECLPDPRILKTHLPLSLFPPSLLDTSKVFWAAWGSFGFNLLIFFDTAMGHHTIINCETIFGHNYRLLCFIIRYRLEIIPDKEVSAYFFKIKKVKMKQQNL